MTVLPENTETIDGEVIETYEHPAGMGEEQLPSDIRDSDTDTPEGTYKLVRVD